MALKIDTKFEGKLTGASKNNMSNLANFHQSTFGSLKLGTFVGSFYRKQKMYELQGTPNYQHILILFTPQQIVMSTKSKEFVT